MGAMESPGVETREKKRRTLSSDLDEESGEGEEEEGEAMRDKR